MSVTDFLYWLFAQISKVTDWFNSRYYTLRYNAEHVYDIALYYAGSILNDAKNYVVDKVRNIWGDTVNLYNSIRNDINGFFNQAKNFALDKFNNAVAEARDLFNYVNSKISNLLDTAKNFAYDIVKSAQAYLKDLLNSGLDTLRNLFNPLLPLKNILSILVALADPKNSGKIFILLDRYFDTLLLFFKSPVGFILGILWPKMIKYFCYLLAYGLGTVNETLPVPPDWSKDE